MRRMTYVDKDGNQIDQSFENRKLLLKFFFVFSIIIPFILIVLIIITIVTNNKCISVYDAIKKASLEYAQDQLELPDVEGDNIEINIDNLYSEQYLKSSSTDNTVCTGTVKITKYKETYVYTLDVKNCNNCSIDKKYKGWSKLQNNYPTNKAIIEVIPYYNYYDRQVITTKWSDEYEESELSDEISDYGINLPLDSSKLPEIPPEATIVDVENKITYYYKYSYYKWKWYDIQGDYSDFSSEKPDGYATIDQNTERYTEWSEYSLDYPEAKEYRKIDTTTGYKYYYLNENNKKIYYNNGKYTPKDEVDTTIYKERDDEKVTLYRYRDRQWRWYNGQKRNYSNRYESTMPEGKPYKDDGLEIIEASRNNWTTQRDTNLTDYKIEERKVKIQFRINYEILSLQALNQPLEKSEFESTVGENISKFNDREDKKMEVTYKFKYRKS